MRYLSILIAVTLTMLFTSACKEESQPVTKEAPQKVVEQAKQEVAPAVATAEEKTEKGMESAQTEANKMMGATHEKMGTMQDGMTPATFSEETLATGKGVYLQSCAACHDSGTMGAPKVGDKTAWASLAAEGVDALTVIAIKGEGKMPPKGGNMQLSDDEVKAAVAYMVDKSK